MCLASLKVRIRSLAQQFYGLTHRNIMMVGLRGKIQGLLPIDPSACSHPDDFPKWAHMSFVPLCCPTIQRI